MKALNRVRLALSFALLIGISARQAPAQTFSQHRDIGSVAAAGNATSGNGTFTVTGSGEDIWGTADEFHYLYIQINGDVEFITRVVDINFTDGWAKAGLMARETLDANSRNVMLFLTPQAISGLQWRASTGGSSSYIDGGYGSPNWLKLVRTGNTFSGYHSANGVNWSLIGSTTIALPSTLYVGLAVTSHHDGTLCTATFDNVTENSSGGGGGGGGSVPSAPTGLSAQAVSTSSIALTWNDNSSNESGFRLERSDNGVDFKVIIPVAANSISYTDAGLSPFTHYWYRLFASNSAGDSPPSNVAEATTSGSGSGSSGWHDQDIGAVSSAGGFTQSGNTYTVGGSGYDIWNNNDEFHYAYQRATNDVQIIARIDGMANTSPWAKAGVMIRQSVVFCTGNACNVFETDGAPNVMLALTPSHGLAFQWRPLSGGSTFYIDAGAASAPVWVKLVKSGNTFTGYRSVDGVNWTQVGTATVDMANTTSLSAGLAVTSHNDGTVCVANFSNISINSSGGGGGGGGTVPAAPSGLTATPYSSTEIRLGWIDNSSNESGFVLERSTDGATFSRLAGASPNITNAWDLALTPGTHYWYRVAATNNAGLSPYSNIADATTPTGGVPPGWHDQDIGTVSAAGSFSQSGGTLTVRGSGSDIWGNADELNYAYQNGTNDAQIVARVIGMDNTSPWAKAGVMIRASVAAGSQHVVLVLTPGNGLAFQWRSTTDGPSSYINAGAASAPVWVKLVKSGNTFTGYRSPDGVNWTQVGTVNIAFPSPTFLAGLAVTADNDGIVCLANFDNVTITSGGGGGGSGGGGALPNPWQEQDIGTSGGSATYANGVFQVIGDGGDIYGTSDGFHFVFEPASGDVTIVAALDKLEPVPSTGSIDPWARIGLMIRESVGGNSKNVMVFLSKDHGTGMTWRDGTGGSTQYIPGSSSARFLKLTRTANTFSAYSSPDGTSWQLIGSATVDISNVLIGLAVTSHSTGGKILGQFSQVAVSSGGGGGGGGGSGGSLYPWQHQDVGPVGLAGSATGTTTLSQGNFTIKGSGADIWGTSDAFHYVYLTVGGNYELVARVTGLQNTEPWAKAGIMFRQSSLSDSANLFVMTTADHGTGLQWRASDGGGSSYVPGPFWSAPVWLKVKRQGNTVTGYTSLDGTSWTLLGTQTLGVQDPSQPPYVFLIGLAVTSHNNTELNTSTFDNVTFTQQ